MNVHFESSKEAFRIDGISQTEITVTAVNRGEVSFTLEQLSGGKRAGLLGASGLCI